jgi:uncharacterized BrkB/YihY/UPF0761 family membrane protein
VLANFAQETNMTNTLRLAVLAISVLLVSAVMLTAGAMAYAITLSLFPFCYVRNTASVCLAVLILELERMKLFVNRGN